MLTSMGVEMLLGWLHHTYSRPLSSSRRPCRHSQQLQLLQQPKSARSSYKQQQKQNPWPQIARFARLPRREATPDLLQLELEYQPDRRHGRLRTTDELHWLALWNRVAGTWKGTPRHERSRHA